MSKPTDNATVPSVDDAVTCDLQDRHCLPFGIQLEDGMGWCLYSDEGPGGISGQSIDITCPHAYLSVWPNESSMRAAMESKSFGRRGKRERVMWGVVGQWTTGKFSITVHR